MVLLMDRFHNVVFSPRARRPHHPLRLITNPKVTLFSQSHRRTGSFLGVLFTATGLIACGGGSPGNNGATNTGSENSPFLGAASEAGDTIAPVLLPVGGLLAPLTDAEFTSLPITEQFRIANRMAAVTYDGLPVDEFLDPTNSFSSVLPAADAFLPSRYQREAQTPLDSAERENLDLLILGAEESNTDEQGPALEARFVFDRERAAQLPLARIFTYPNSLDRLSQWMSWHLANTILFSPSAELESAGMTDVQNIIRRLDKAFLSDAPIRQIVFEHMRSQENWRRFRSPEDNTREMMEIYLGLEDMDAEVPAASKACQDLYLTDESDGYQLAYTDFPNGEAQTVLGQSVVSCDDFYRAVSEHERLLPVVTSVLVNYFFSTREPAFKQQVVAELVGSGASTFRELFLAIVFSSAYLLDTEVPKSFEENFLAMAKRIRWMPRRDLFRSLVSGNGGMRRAHMREMGWPAMTSKLGRSPVVPLDALSFANYHKALRENLLMDSYRWQTALGVREPEVPDPAPLPPPPDNASQQAIADYETVLQANQQIIDAMPESDRLTYFEEVSQYHLHLERHEQLIRFNLPEFIDYLFLSVVLRKALPEEREALTALFDEQGWLRIEVEGQYLNRWNRTDAARLVLDYLSRLPEIYYHRALEEEAA